jgi:hypothetical protein
MGGRGVETVRGGFLLVMQMSGLPQSPPSPQFVSSLSKKGTSGSLGGPMQDRVG